MQSLFFKNIFYLHSPLPASRIPTDSNSHAFIVYFLILMYTLFKCLLLVCVHVFYIYINDILLQILLLFLF